MMKYWLSFLTFPGPKGKKLLEHETLVGEMHIICVSKMTPSPGLGTW